MNAALAAIVVAVCLAEGATATAQPVDATGVPGAVPPRIEIGGGAGLMVAYPEFGALASVPLGPGASFEVAASWLPRIVYEREHGLIQAQVRVPFRAALRSRRSLLLGLTRLSTRRQTPFDSGFWGDDLNHLFPHAGVSLQWPLGRRVDLRLDAQGLFTFDGELPLIARAAALLVWHPGSAR